MKIEGERKERASERTIASRREESERQRARERER